MLDQIIVDIQTKNEALLKLNPKQETRSWEWVLGNEPNSCVEELEISFKQDNMEIASCDANTLKWEKEIKYLQSKVIKAKKRKFEFKNVIRAKLDEKTLIGLQHFDNASALEAEIEGITTSTLLTDLRLYASKAHFERIKDTLPF